MRKLLLVLMLAPLLNAPLHAEEGLVTFKSMNIDLALALARAALADCQKHGYQVSVAVVDRFGITQVLLRDRFAGAHTVPTATGKAWTAVSFRTDTSELVAATQPGSPQAGVRAIPRRNDHRRRCYSRSGGLAYRRHRRLRRAGRRQRRSLRQGRHRRGARQVGFLKRMIPKSMSSTPIGDGNRFSVKIMRKK